MRCDWKLNVRKKEIKGLPEFLRVIAGAGCKADRSKIIFYCIFHKNWFGSKKFGKRKFMIFSILTLKCNLNCTPNAGIPQADLFGKKY